MESYEVQQALRAVVDHDEDLLWTGQPKQGLMLRPGDAFVIPFSLLWCGFAIFWTLTASQSVLGPDGFDTTSPINYFLPLWGLGFVAIGLYMVVGRFFTDALLRKNTLYGITNRRIVLRSGLFRPTTRSMDITALPELTLTEYRDGTGTLSFRPDFAMSRRSASRLGVTPPMMGNAFERIAEPKRAYQILSDARQAALTMAR